MRDLPSIASSTYGSAAVDLDTFANAVAGNGFVAQNRRFNVMANPVIPAQNNLMEQAIMAAAAARRLVQVFIADPNDNIPLDQSLLYSGEQKLTDATDQELFFEIDIKSILEKHNEKRIKLVDKKIKERTEYLEPAKIRDLKMVVVTVAGF